MKKTMFLSSRLRTVLALLLVCTLTFCLSGTALAAESSGSSYEIYIDDQADLLTDAEEQALQETMSENLGFGNMMFTTVTLPDGTDYETNAENSYYEKFGNAPGVNFQIDMGNRKLTLSASTAMEDQIGSERDSIVDNIYTYASDEDYAGCATECFAEIYKVLHGYQISHKMKYINNAIIALILGLMINFLIIFAGFRTSASRKELQKTIFARSKIRDVDVRPGSVTKRYDPVSSGSGSGGGGGGGFSGGGGGGGGGFSGGSSSHGF